MTIGQPDWTRAVKLLGEYAGELVNVSVDANGNLFCVFKGDYEGELRTVTLDDAGRISAFIYDSIDAWGQISSVGFAELAARLGSPVVYERSGQTYLQETFNSGMGSWDKKLVGTGAEILLTPKYYEVGDYSVKMTGGNNSLRYAWVQKHLSLLPVKKIGLTVAFSINSEIEAFEIGFSAYSGLVWTYVHLRWESSTKDLKVFVDSNEWRTIESNCDLIKSPKVFNHIKMIADIENQQWDNVRWNANLISCDQYKLYAPASGYSPSLIIDIYNQSRAGHNDVIYLDKVILTLAEPD